MRGRHASPKSTSPESLVVVGSSTFVKSRPPRPIGDDSRAKATPEDVVEIFKYLDTDGNGKIDRTELATLLSDLDSTYWTTKRIRALFRAADLDRDQCISWQEFCNWVFSRGEEQHVMRSAVPLCIDAKKVAEHAALEAEQAARAAEQAALKAEQAAKRAAKQAALEAEQAAKRAAEQAALDAEQAVLKAALEAEQAGQRELRSKHLASLVAAETISALSAALDSAEHFFEGDELQEHRKRLETMRLPFAIVIMTMATGEFSVEVRRDQSVTSLCQVVEKLVDKKAYRILLAHEGGRLEPPSATLEDCGVKGPMRLAVQFGEADPLMEKPLSEFLTLVKKHFLASEVAALEKEYNEARISEEDFRGKFKTTLAERMSAEEDRRMREAVQKENRRKAAEERRRVLILQHQAKFESLPFDALLAQAVDTQIVQRGDAIPEDQRDGLLQRMALAAAVRASEAAIQEVNSQFDSECDKYRSCSRVLELCEELRQNITMCESLPEFEKAVRSLKALTSDDLKSLRDPELSEGFSEGPRTRIVLAVFEHLCIMFGLEPEIMVDPNKPGKEVRSYLEVAQKSLFLDPQIFLDKLLDFDKDNVPESIIRSVAPFVGASPYVIDPSLVGKAVHAICLWMQAVYRCHLEKTIPTKRIALDQMDADRIAADLKIKSLREEFDTHMLDLHCCKEALAAPLGSGASSGTNPYRSLETTDVN